ncbi:acylphosphatase [Magnetovibrio sp. PR-2]|uniref:acylphosphatase n=1 Tax=Magnetovibrio sp. PR-2 TaxID=3120356 RepID=UPI002FCE04AA
MSDLVAQHAIISGRVQGVWYRAWTQKTARKLGLKGWVRNRRDGTVEAVFCGTSQQIKDMAMACQKGPPLANVTGVELSDADVPNEDDFELRETC